MTISPALQSAMVPARRESQEDPMLVAESLSVQKRSQGGRSVSSWMPRRLPGIGGLISSPVFCLGLTLLGLAPLLFA